MDILNVIQVPYFKKGNGIHIKKKNRGKFTEYCGGKVTQECIDKAKKSKNPTLRKRATFAQNSRAWKHQKGGELVPSRNWDNTLTGKLINYSENPDSIGWDAKNKRWYAPPANKGYDTNQFGMGVDRNQTPGFNDKVKKDKQGREYLTAEDERQLRFLAIDRANKSANDRYAYAQKATGTKGSVSPKQDAITVSAIYNLGPGRVARTLFEDMNVMKSLFDRNSDDYQKAVHKQYKNKNRNERVDRELEFFKKRNL